MVEAIVRCCELDKSSLVPTYISKGELVCSGCGVVNPKDHQFYIFIGAYCKQDRVIHYRWVDKNWRINEPRLFRRKKPDDPHITPIITEHRVDKYFKANLLWNLSKEECKRRVSIEVIWNNNENNKMSLNRPTDSGFLYRNNLGMHAPFLAALYEWLCQKNQWDNLLDPVRTSKLSDREKKILIDAITIKSPSRIFKMLWTFNRFIPGWHFRRTLGRRSPSMLLQDEIRWTTNRFDNLTKSDILRLKRCGPEQMYWGTWQELWPSSLELNNNLSEFGKELPRLGIRYAKTLSLINEPNRQIGERSWKDIVLKLIHWPVKFENSGQSIVDISLRRKNGFFDKLKELIQFNPQVKEPYNIDEWDLYLKKRMPILWSMSFNRENNSFQFSCPIEFFSISLLEKTLIILEPWLNKKAAQIIQFTIVGTPTEKIEYLSQSFQNRLEGTSISINFKDIEN